MSAEDKYTRRRLQTSQLSTIVSISLVLFMLGVLGLIVLNARKLSDYVKENIGFSIILKDEVKENEILKLKKSLDAADYVKSTEFITKEQAAERLKEDLGEDFIEFLGYNPLLASIDVRLKADYANNDSIAWIEKDLMRNTRIKEVYYQKSLVDLVNQNLKKISLVILVFSVMLMTIAIALINNSIRLSIYSRRFLIKSMQLVGATQGFIRRPFIIKSILHGIYGAIIAIFLLLGLMFLARNEFPELIQSQDTETFISLFLMVVVLGVMISMVSTYLGVRKYLRLKVDQLYS